MRYLVLAALLCFAQPAASQTTEIKVQVTQQDTVELRIVVVTAMRIATDSTNLPNGVELTAYVFQLVATGVPAGHTVLWSIDSGSLPPGLSLEPTTGRITGIAAAGSLGRHEFVIRATTVPPNGGNER